MNNGIPTENGTDKILRTSKGNTVTIKYTDRSPEIRSELEAGGLPITNDIAFALAERGIAEGSVIVGGEGTRLKESLKKGFYLPDAKPLNVSIVLRPVILAKNAAALPAMASVAAARAIESISDMKIGLMWANDLCVNGKVIATVRTDSFILHDNFVGYIVLGVAFNVINDGFEPRLSDIVAAVFNNQSQDASERLCEAFLAEFFELYESYTSDRSFMKEYRSRSLLAGRNVKVRVGRRKVQGCVRDIDDDAMLVVELKNGERVNVASPTDVII